MKHLRRRFVPATPRRTAPATLSKTRPLVLEIEDHLETAYLNLVRRPIRLSVEGVRRPAGPFPGGPTAACGRGSCCCCVRLVLDAAVVLYPSAGSVTKRVGLRRQRTVLDSTDAKGNGRARRNQGNYRCCCGRPHSGLRIGVTLSCIGRRADRLAPRS